MESKRRCARVEIELTDGTTVYPVTVKNRATRRMAYRISDGGKGGNTLARTCEVEEPEMVAGVRRGMAVRAANAARTRAGQYRAGGRAVVEVRVDGTPI